MKLGCVEALARCFVFVRARVKLGVGKKLGCIEGFAALLCIRSGAYEAYSILQGLVQASVEVFRESSGTLPGLFRESSGTLPGGWGLAGQVPTSTEADQERQRGPI